MTTYGSRGDVMIEPRPLIALLDDAVERHGLRVAMRMDDAEWTYRDLADMVNRSAAQLASHGVTRGSRIALSAGISPEFVAAVFAAFHLGAAVVMVSTAWRDREVDHALTLTEPTHFITDGSGATDIARRITDRPVLHVDDLRLAPVAAPQPPAAVDLDDVIVMVFSSGTTGLPKAVRHTHRTMSHATAHWVETLGMTSDDRLQIATPPFHILGLLNLLAVVAAGAGIRLHRRFDLEAVLSAVAIDRITIEMAVAPIALAMAPHPDLERFDLSSLRYIMWGATPVTPSVAETVTRRSGVRFLPAYGASELPVLAVNPVHQPNDWQLDSVGLPPTGVELRVVDLDTSVVAEPGQPGELQARGASMMLGYLPDEANDEAIVDGWYRTGDVGTVDAKGWVTITDRVKEMIKVNGFQVAPAEVETVLLGHPDVLDCAVFAVPHPTTGESVTAAVVLAAGSAATADDLRDLVARDLAGYKRVTAVYLVDQIPRLASGKVLRRELQASYRS